MVGKGTNKREKNKEHHLFFLKILLQLPGIAVGNLCFAGIRLPQIERAASDSSDGAARSSLVCYENLRECFDTKSKRFRNFTVSLIVF